MGIYPEYQVYIRYIVRKFHQLSLAGSCARVIMLQQKTYCNRDTLFFLVLEACHEDFFSRFSMVYPILWKCIRMVCHCGDDFYHY